MRPRGWHLDEKHVTVDGQRVSGGIFDFAPLPLSQREGAARARQRARSSTCRSSRAISKRVCGTTSSSRRRRRLASPRGSIRATVLIETILAAFEMDEILYELREHSSGLNAGRWDYIFSAIKKFKRDRDFCLADRAQVTMTVAVHARLRAGAAEHLPPGVTRHAIGGHERADSDQERPGRERQGHGRRALGQGRATPPTATTAAGSRTRASGADRDGGVRRRCSATSRTRSASSATTCTSPRRICTDFRPEAPITEAGLRNNINVGIHYLGSWLAGNGCVPIHNLMEDAATAEISRSQVWQWIRSPKGKLDDGRKVTAELVRELADRRNSRR